MKPIQQWRKLLHECVARRIEVDVFCKLVKILARRAPLQQAYLVGVLLESRAVTADIFPYDPLIPRYATALRKLGLIRTATLLDGLRKQPFIESQSTADAEQSQKTVNSSILMTDTRIVQDLIAPLSSSSPSLDTQDIQSIFAITAEWILDVARWHTSNINDENQMGGLMSSPDALALFESLGILLVALSATAKGHDALASESTSDFKIPLGQALTAYLSTSASISLNLRNRLDSLQKGYQLYGEPPSKDLDVQMMDGMSTNALQFEASVLDGPVINSRAGLYIYINALLIGRPLIDDEMLLSYLSNRYGGQQEVLIQELITATFDVLSNAMYRNESTRNMFVFRSFLVNKLPPFLAGMAATSIEQIPMEMCISHALNRVDPNAFPSFSQMFEMQGNTVLSDVRQEFLFACALHRLIPESSIERLLGENPMQTLPVGGRYVKNDIVAQILSNQGAADRLISEIELMEGNAGAVVAAVTDVINSLCEQKETVTLKSICDSLSRRPQVLDVMLLFCSPKSILQPLCTLLDSWKWDEDQGESQPVYDEFGSILLLVMAFKYRYDLSQYDLGVTASSSFVLKLFERGSTSMKLASLDAKQNKSVGDWISALFMSEGISEETWSSCSPQEFYLLVATLFSQTLGACEMGMLELDTIKGGFEYLLQPFLLPSLVFALKWLGNFIWESPEADLLLLLKVLRALVKPNSISGEAEACHQTVLNIAAQSLEEQLKDVRTRLPGGRSDHQSDIQPNPNQDIQQEIQSLLDILEPYLSFQCNGNSRRSELDSWTTHTDGICGVIRVTFQGLILWSASAEMSMSPHAYTHRLILVGIRLSTASNVLSALLDELRAQAEEASGSLDLAIDIAATLICAPIPESFAQEQTIYHPIDSTKEAFPRCLLLTLRQALMIQHQNVPRLSEKDPTRAEVIVRLTRRVNALLTPPAHVGTIDVTNIIDNMNLEAAAAAAGHDVIDLNNGNGTGNDGGAGAPGESIDQILNNVVAATSNDHHGTGNESQDLDVTGMDTSLDDILNAAHMGNPEFLDLDMDGMF
ncbi:mediator complex subunit [Talaromyces marneffei ATCC 18224]|uniref:Mediator of RNA polymerase II transcription subunit 5 n=1 Tax=Talaromyces marneffei (strain ATCC 18224 / CBS 334.59 / QM 7333) TaxID=441960 RepID=B6Q263_TALMQ|nr:RNA polymerase II mediator complex subunit Nut1, putative [Talaromyces marneffei ATCC 18224]KAE8556390.1 hypothetical protein EYB25_001091 [Talaromyces marneffei]